jgi:tetratricopeptide (TPR) repeat protein
MTEPSKPRTDAWDAALTERQRWEAYERFRQFTWRQVATWLEEEHGIETSKTALYRWASRMRKLESAHRIEQAIEAREEAGELAASAKQNDSALIEAYKTLGADIALRTGDAKAASKFLRMALDISEANRAAAELDLKARAQETKDKALRLAREKFEAAERRLAAAKTTFTDAKLTPAERESKLKEIFGLR